MKRSFAILILFVFTLPLVAQTPAPAQAAPAQQPPQQGTAAKPAKALPDRAAAYYHYSLAHLYEEMVAVYGRMEFASKAIEEYRLAMENDPGSELLAAGLAELYAKTGRIRDAVLEAQDILKRDPNNLEARKLLGRIYLRSLGDPSTGSQSAEMLRLAIEQYEHISRIEPKAIDNHLLLGRLYSHNKDLMKAEQAFKTALQQDPESEEAVVNLAYLYNDRGEPKRAAETLLSVPETRRSAKLYAALGYTYEQQREHDKAVEAYSKAVDLDNENLDALRGLAQNLVNAGKAEEALKYYKMISDADPQDAPALLRMAEIYRRTGKFALAHESLKKAEALVQNSLEVPYNRALIYEAEGKYAEAAAVLQKLLETETKPLAQYTTGEMNNRAVFLERLGIVQRASGKIQPAVEAFRKMLDLGDENASRAYQHLIETYREAKQYDQALAIGREAVSKFPNDRGLKLVLAGQLADVGQTDAAVEMAQKLLAGSEEDRDVYIAIGQIQSRNKRWKEAEEALTQADKFADRPEEKNYLSLVRGSMYERQKRFDDAEREFRKILATDPENAVVLNYLGYMLADRGVRLDEAVNFIRKALELDPQNGAYLDSLGWAYFRQGKMDLAESFLRRAVERIPNDATIHDHLADVYFKQGKLKQAIMHWERAIAEWGRTTSAEVDTTEVAKVQKKLETAKVKVARERR